MTGQPHAPPTEPSGSAAGSFAGELTTGNGPAAEPLGSDERAMTTPAVLDYAPPDRAVPVWAKVAAAVVVAVVVWLSVHGVRKPTAQLGDFGAYYRAGGYVAAGGSPYQLDPKFRELGAYVYAPAFAYVVCRPLAALPYVWAMRAFVAINWAATAGAVWLSLRLLEQSRAVSARGDRRSRPSPEDAGSAGPGPTRPGSVQANRFWVGAIACVAVGSYLYADLHNGQVGTLLLVSCLAWATLTLAGRPALGGACLSVAVGLKIYPLLLAPYLLQRRWWPGLIGLAVGLGVLFVTPSLFVGGRGLLPLHREWLRFCLATQRPDQTVRTGNQSLLGVLARTPPVSDGVHLYSTGRLHGLEHAYPIVVLAVTAALFGLLVWRRWGPAVDLSLLLVWATVAAPRAWTFNFAAELPAAAVLAAVIVRRGPRWPWAVAALVGVLAAVVFNTNDWLADPVRWSIVPQLLWDKHFLAAIGLMAAVASTAGRPGRTIHHP